MVPTTAMKNVLFNDLLPLPELFAPPIDEATACFLINLRRDLWQQKIALLPESGSQEHTQQFVLMAHRLDAQCELLNILLEQLTTQINEERTS